MAFCSVVSGVVWATVPAGPARVTWLIRPSCRLMFRQVWPLPRSATRVSSRASQDVGADAVFEAVEHRPQQEVGLQVAEAAFGFQEILVAQCGVFGTDVR